MKKMLVLTILLLTLDFKRLELPDDAMTKSFTVSPLENESLTGCATNPQSGGSNPLTIDRSEPPEFATEITTSAELPSFEKNIATGGIFGRDTHIGGRFERDICDHQPMVIVPPGDEPTPSPVAVTPEPSTVAILGITAAVLLYVLFGKRYGRKPSRYF